MAFDWIAGLFQSEQTRGLSGDSASAVALDESNPYYNYRLRRHQAEGDLIAEPGLVWYTSPFVQQRAGLGTHIAAEKGEGVANFTDILLILSREDAANAPPDYGQQAERALSQEFETFCRREQFSRIYSHRKLGFKLLVDGSAEMGGQSLGLTKGQFITGLLPNLYTGPVRGSFPVIGVHLNLPGVFEGYQEIGRLHNDQILFTIGSHWLDNFSHPSLREAALYRLQQYPDGSFVHIVNPDLQDRYQVTSREQSGTNVLTLATRDGVPLAYMVLAVMEAPDEVGTEISEEEIATRPNIAMPVAPDQPQKKPAQPSARPATETPDVAPPMLLDDGVENISAKRPKGKGGKTIIPDAPSERIFTLQERGALLQKVHFSAFMDGYDVYMGPRGELGTVVDNPAATFQVRKRTVSLRAHVDLQIGGRRLPAGSDFVIDGDTTIEIGGEKLQYRDLRGLDVDGWPYVGEIRRPASSTYMIWGEQYRIGRSRECRVVLPDEPRNDNIAWKASVGDGATIRARTGEIPKSRFYTDSIMVASEHAVLDTKSATPELTCTARHCYVYIRRNGEVMPLFPTTSGKSPQTLNLQTGDEVLIGNCLFQAGFSDQAETNQAPASAPGPEPHLNADSLADAVSAPDFDDLDDDERTGTGIEMYEEPTLRSEPLEQAGMESVMGSTSTAPHVADLKMELPSLEDVGDDPTSPGMTIPRELLEDTNAVHDIEEPEDLQDSLGAEEPVDVRKDVVKGWEDDDWEDDTGPQSVPPELGGPDDDTAAAILAPFPEAELQNTLPEPFVDPEVTEPPPIPVAPPETPVAEPEAEPEPEADATLEATYTWNPDAPVEDSPAAPADVVEERPAAPVAVEEPTEPPVSEDAELATEVVESGEADDETVMDHPRVDPPVAPAPPRFGTVVFTDDSEAQFELGRPLHLVQAGWMAKGDMVAGNHTGADLVIPENRIEPDQTFAPADYFRLKVRGRKGHLEVLAPSEMLINEDDPTQEVYENLADITIDLIRRDDQGEEDFVVRVVVSEDRSLPDPRARFIALDYEDPLAAALVTRGLGLNQTRTLVFDGISIDLEWTGEAVRFSNYLAGYQGAEPKPFFTQSGKQRFVTAPEDGSVFELVPGDRFVIGSVVYLIRGL